MADTNPVESKDTTITVQSKDEARLLQKMQQLSPSDKVGGFIERITTIEDSQQYEKYHKNHDGLMAELVKANGMLPDPMSKPVWWKRILMMLPVVGESIKKGIEKKQFESGGTINAIQKLLNKVDKSYLVLRNDIEPTKKLMREFQDESDNIRSQILKLEQYVQETELSPEAQDFAAKYIQQEKISVEELEHTFVPWLQEIINTSERLYLNYASERKSLAMSLTSTAKILQKVGVVETAADGLLVLRDTKQRSKLLAQKAMGRMRTKSAEVESKMLHSLEEFATVKALDEESLAEAENIKLLGEAERNELSSRIKEFRLTNKGGLADGLKMQLPGGEDITLLDDIQAAQNNRTEPEVDYLEVDDKEGSQS